MNFNATLIVAPALLAVSFVAGCTDNSQPKTLREKAEQAQQDLAEAREDAAEMISDAEVDAVDIVADARDEAKEGIQRATEDANELVRDAEQKLDETLDAIENKNLVPKTTDTDQPQDDHSTTIEVDE
ncbi:hypothetical protein NHH03_15440 [Stieleria sp. TO1_6]|uniref:hypothetical protein n=1 Tax=Stieleria tagensis TaxID=2956795 RepID=UPI00209AF866|nr:hypothetical protein [Stieleria tagensis]MCO8123141.1 hypothetical protein [Stieleria tagensis]